MSKVFDANQLYAANMSHSPFSAYRRNSASTHVIRDHSILNHVNPSLPPQDAAPGSLQLPAISELVTQNHLQYCGQITAVPKTVTREKSRNLPTFDNLVQTMLQHPLLPLIFKATYEVCSDASPIITDARSEKVIQFALNKSARVQRLARNVDANSQMNSEGVEVFLVALHTALNSLRAPVQPRPAVLHSMITACMPQTLPSPPTNFVIPDKTVVKRCSSPTSPTFVNTSKPKLGGKARKILDAWFDAHFDSPYPTENEKLVLARECNLQLNQINNYFSNRRMRMKRKYIEFRNQNATRKSLLIVKPQLSQGSSALAPRSKWQAIMLNNKFDGAHKVPFTHKSELHEQDELEQARKRQCFHQQ